jgi:hypothetical protein
MFWTLMVQASEPGPAPRAENLWLRYTVTFRFGRCLGLMHVVDRDLNATNREVLLRPRPGTL